MNKDFRGNTFTKLRSTASEEIGRFGNKLHERNISSGFTVTFYSGYRRRKFCNFIPMRYGDFMTLTLTLQKYVYKDKCTHTHVHTYTYRTFLKRIAVMPNGASTVTRSRIRYKISIPIFRMFYEIRNECGSFLLLSFFFHTAQLAI